MIRVAMVTLVIAMYLPMTYMGWEGYIVDEKPVWFPILSTAFLLGNLLFISRTRIFRRG